MGGPGRKPDIARAAFDAVAAAREASTLAELDAVFGRSLQALGFDTFVGLNVLDPGGNLNFGVLFGQTHAAWEQRYMEKGYARSDAVLKALITDIEPVYWSDVTGRRPLETDEQRVFDEAAEHGLTEGFATPIRLVDGSLSAVLLIGSDVDARDPDTRTAAHFLSLHYGTLAQKIRRAQALRLAPPLSLSPRQLECLKWVRHGKSSSDIGDLLGLSGRTVDHYLADACARLGVRTRHQAVIEAALRGLFEL